MSYTAMAKPGTQRREIPLHELPRLDDSLADTEIWHLRRIAADSFTIKEIGKRARISYETAKRRDSDYDLAALLAEHEYVPPSAVADIVVTDAPKVRLPGDEIPEDCAPTRLDPLFRVNEWQTKRVWRASRGTSDAARKLGIARQELNRRIKRYGIRQEDRT